MIYPYECQACKHVWEVTQKMEDAPPTECPECKHNEVRRILSKAPAPVVFKGPGWFNTGGYGST